MGRRTVWRHDEKGDVAKVVADAGMNLRPVKLFKPANAICLQRVSTLVLMPTAGVPSRVPPNLQSISFHSLYFDVYVVELDGMYIE